MGDCGIKWELMYYFYHPNRKPVMITFIGDYSCRLDEKGRVLLPAAFIKQMAGSMQEKFVLKKDIFE